MKAKSTAQKQIRRLEAVFNNANSSEALRRYCYDTINTMRWFIENTDWSPAGDAEKEARLARRCETCGRSLPAILR